MKKRLIICVLIIVMAIVMITPAFATLESSCVYTYMHSSIDDDLKNEALLYFAAIFFVLILSIMKHLIGISNDEDSTDTHHSHHSYHRRHRSHTHTHTHTHTHSRSSHRSSSSRSFRSSGRGGGGRSGGGGGGRR